MPLKRGDAEPEADALGVDFEMIAPDGDAVSCLITRSALELLQLGTDGGPLRTDGGTITVEEQLAVFKQWRDLIETTASHKYDSLQIERGFVVVRSEDLKAKPGSLQ
jgi:hypothetical protein